MKNIHILPTDKPSRIYSYKGNSFLTTESHLHSPSMEYQNIYITNSEEIKEGDWFLDDNNQISRSYRLSHVQFANPKKIILTTDQDLIKDGVQAIDDEFLEWFIKNTSCEYIKTEKWLDDEGKVLYSRIIPKEELSTKLHKGEIVDESYPKEFKQQCKDCNDNLTDCTCIEDTIDMKQETREYDLLQHIKFCLECKNESQAIRLIEKYGFQKQEEMYNEEDLEVAYFEGKEGLYSFNDLLKQFKNK